jgi:hypothetical protein
MTGMCAQLAVGLISQAERSRVLRTADILVSDACRTNGLYLQASGLHGSPRCDCAFVGAPSEEELACLMVFPCV